MLVFKSPNVQLKAVMTKPYGTGNQNKVTGNCTLQLIINGTGAWWNRLARRVQSYWYSACKYCRPTSTGTSKYRYRPTCIMVVIETSGGTGHPGHR